MGAFIFSKRGARFVLGEEVKKEEGEDGLICTDGFISIGGIFFFFLSRVYKTQTNGINGMFRRLEKCCYYINLSSRAYKMY